MDRARFLRNNRKIKNGEMNIMNYIIPKENIQINETAYRFQGSEYGDIPVSFFWVFTLPDRGPGLHIHPYEEVFVLQQLRIHRRLRSFTKAGMITSCYLQRRLLPLLLINSR